MSLHGVSSACLALALLVGACSDGGSSDADGGVVRSVAGRPGTDLGDGFTVAEGTLLLGAPIPIGVAVVYNGVEILDDGWEATFVIDDGQPAAIVEDFLAQAAAVGLQEQPGTGCVAEDELWLCVGFARSPDDTVPHSLSVETVRGRSDDVVSDHVVVRYSTTDFYWEYGSPVLDPSGAVDVPEPEPEPFLPLPDVGETIGTAGETVADVEVQDGSRLVGPPRLNLDDASGGVVAILEVTDAPRAVLTRYVEHLEAISPGLTSGDPAELQVGGARLTRVSMESAGGDYFDLSLVEREGRPTWLVIQGSHD